jgi:hypothetical protein
MVPLPFISSQGTNTVSNNDKNSGAKVTYVDKANIKGRSALLENRPFVDV